MVRVLGEVKLKGLRLVNGLQEPTLPLDTGEWVQLRVTFAAWHKGNLNLAVPGCELFLLAKDGIYIRDFPRRIATAPVVPGGRADILVRCPLPCTIYTIQDHDSKTIGFIETGKQCKRRLSSLGRQTIRHTSQACLIAQHRQDALVRQNLMAMTL